jgi:hypothetical protein
MICLNLKRKKRKCITVYMSHTSLPEIGESIGGTGECMPTGEASLSSACSLLTRKVLSPAIRKHFEYRRKEGHQNKKRMRKE